ncbi:low molecular weight phosphatase family protein [Microbacterium sp. NPDC089180]|uniref:Low molecular weight phosphatase family protein n=1 Tax=Microbacterium galbum TaxID=3075994 RepID=A0ABU3T4T9_9MICO|nr:low molecular weight phosphatase family protein [Microbacterium sp. KSW4-17]MDU0366388.1 low molecular weight phosphatase family protein [Microbacterium sp. KSW4-17]
MTFSILSVCTGNICRSPVAELLIASELESLSTVKVSSAGTGALVGSGIPDQAQQLAATAGLDPSGHVARQYDMAMLREADLIVAMAREHRRIVVETFPGAMRRSFTLRELARIAAIAEPSLPDAVRGAGASSADEGMRAAVALASTLRGTVPPPASPDEFDIVDPYRRSDETYRRSFEELAPAARRVATFLRTAADIAVAS